MRLPALLVLALACLAPLAPAAAQTPPKPGEAPAAQAQPPETPPGAPMPPPDPQGAVRRQVSDARALSATSTCFYGPHIDEAQGKRLCNYQTRSKLLDSAVSQLASTPAVAQAAFSAQDLRAFVDSLLKIEVANEETRALPDGLGIRLTLRAESDPGVLTQRLQAFAANPELRAAALTETAKRDRQAAEARMAAVPFGADREFRAKEMQNQMQEDASFADRRVVPGMSMPQVKELLGNPGTLKQAVIGSESYMCAGYGRMWIVFRDGLVSCLRTRLDYVQSYGTDCHCAGNYATILKSE